MDGTPPGKKNSLMQLQVEVETVAGATASVSSTIKIPVVFFTLVTIALSKAPPLVTGITTADLAPAASKLATTLVLSVDLDVGNAAAKMTPNWATPGPPLSNLKFHYYF